MNDTILYLNTDLEISSRHDLARLASALEAHGMYRLHDPAKGDDGLWCVWFETETSFNEPEPNIAAIVAAIETLDESMQAEWSRCSLREFNIGYDCGSKPWAFNQGLSSELLGRIAAIGASLRWTLYPPEYPKNS